MGGKPAESTLHGNLYKRYPQIGGIVHTHSPYAILNSLNFSQVDLVTMHSELEIKISDSCCGRSYSGSNRRRIAKGF